MQGRKLFIAVVKNDQNTENNNNDLYRLTLFETKMKSNLTLF